MNRISEALLAFILCLLPLTTQEEAAGGEIQTPPQKPPPANSEKLAEPSSAAQDAAAKSIRDVFKADFAKTAPADYQALGRKLLQQARETKTDRAAQFVLFQDARVLAASGGDVKTAFLAIDEADKIFVIDAFGARHSMLALLPPPASHEAAAPMFDAALSVTDETARAGHYDLALSTLRIAEGYARTPTNVTLMARVQARVSDVRELQRESEAIRVAEETLAKNRNDLGACLQVGRFTCFVKGDWEKGLPLLRTCSDANLRNCAETELSEPLNADVRMDLADAWMAAAEKEPTALAKANLKARARQHYLKALPGLVGFPKTKAEARLQGLNEEENSRWSVNLLTLLDAKKDGVKGDWTYDGKTLVSPPIQWAKLQVPYAPPEEYDLTVVLARKAGPDGVVIGLVGGGKQLYGIVDGGNTTAGGLEMIEGRAWPDNETLYRTRIFPDDKPRTLLWSVRKNRVTFMVDGKTFIDWKADYRRIAGNSGWVVPSKKALMLGSWMTSYHFTELWLTPISGPGQKLR